jgi:hypothetical protein
MVAILFLHKPVYEWHEQKRYKRERLRFAKEVAEGKAPDWCPTTIGFNGSIRIDPDDLMHTKSFQDQMRAISKIANSATLLATPTPGKDVRKSFFLPLELYD